METATVDRGVESTRTSWRVYATVVLLAGIAAIAVVGGLRLRRAMWDYTDGAHFKGDVGNAFFWGRETGTSGLFGLYDAVDHQTISEPGRKIDYPPMRLVMATIWGRWAMRKWPDATEWQDDYDFTAPLLWMNTVAELLSCALIFLTIRLWRRREAPGNRNLMIGVWAGMAGALLFWFNPAIIWDGHCWPQWDVLPIPFFVGAVLLASLDWWLAAGICVAIGASLKGQMLLAAPVLLVWPIARLRFGAAFRWVVGLIAATIIIATPWMRPSPPGLFWLGSALVGMAGVLPFVFELDLPRRAKWILLGVGVVLSWPWATVGAPFLVRFVPLGVVGLLIAARWLPRLLRIPAALLAVAILMSLMIPLYGASANWFTYGYEYGTEKFAFMVTGSGTFNLPRMMVVYLQWPPSTSEPVTLPILGDVTFTMLTRIVFGFCLVICGIGAAIHDRRRERRFLASMVAPWLLCYMILTQMHGRYSVWAAGISALLAGVGPGMALLGVLVSVVSLMGIVENQLLFSRDWSPALLEFLSNCNPGVGWMLLVAMLVMFYFATVPRSEVFGS